MVEVAFAPGSRLERVESRAFAGTGLLGFVAPENLREVGEQAFWGCRRLEQVDLGGGVQKIGAMCFFGTPLKRVKGPARLVRDAKALGLGYDEGKVQTFPDALQVLSAWDVRRMDVEVLVVPRNVRELEKEAFRENGVRHVLFSEGSALAKIGVNCFMKSGLEEITFPPNVRVLEHGAFRDCTFLKSVVLNEGLAVVGASKDGAGTFQGAALEVISLPSTLRVLGQQTFCGCRGLQSVVLPKGLEEVGYACFQDTGLEAVSVPASVRIIGGGAFLGCSKLKTLVFEAESKLEEVGNNAFGGTGLRRDKVAFPAGAHVADSAF